MGLANVTRTPIRNVEIIGPCRFKQCKRPMVLVTFNNDKAIKVHDDGSFIEWLGESNGGE